MRGGGDWGRLPPMLRFGANDDDTTASESAKKGGKESMRFATKIYKKSAVYPEESWFFQELRTLSSILVEFFHSPLLSVCVERV